MTAARPGIVVWDIDRTLIPADLRWLRRAIARTNEVAQASFRIHGGYGYSTEYEIERLMREAPFMLIGEGTSEIQKRIIAKGVMRDYRL